MRVLLWKTYQCQCVNYLLNPFDQNKQLLKFVLIRSKDKTWTYCGQIVHDLVNKNQNDFPALFRTESFVSIIFSALHAYYHIYCFVLSLFSKYVYIKF
jgi:hypothetical protein